MATRPELHNGTPWFISSVGSPLLATRYECGLPDISVWCHAGYLDFLVILICGTFASLTWWVFQSVFHLSHQWLHNRHLWFRLYIVLHTHTDVIRVITAVKHCLHAYSCNKFFVSYSVLLLFMDCVVLVYFICNILVSYNHLYVWHLWSICHST